MKAVSKHKLCRRLGKPICGLSKCPALKRPYPAGAHGKVVRRGKKSVFALQLEEKQKVKFIYGVSETQLKNLFQKVSGGEGPAGEHLLALLESRLDNIVYRLGFAPTRWAARQMVAHGHMRVNARAVNIRSFRLKPGDKIRVDDKSKLFNRVQEHLKETGKVAMVPYLSLDNVSAEGSFLSEPARDQIPEDIEEHLVVEYYAK